VKLILIPGWNEAADDLQLLVNGRRRKRGFRDYGFDCVIFGEGKGGLRDRIDQFAGFLAGIKSVEPQAFPIATFGYSAGGLINRGFLRAFPERSGEVGATVQVAAPNAVIVTDDVAATLRMLRVSGDVVEDLDNESEFITRLNGTTGHWETEADKRKRWRLDKEPWVAPPAAPLLHIVGCMPRYDNESDGIVTVDSATLEGRVPHHKMSSRSANHLNLTGVWNPLTWLLRRWRCDDEVWPVVVDRTAAFIVSEAAKRSAAR
jgi:hypothetical protein